MCGCGVRGMGLSGSAGSQQGGSRGQKEAAGHRSTSSSPSSHRQAHHRRTRPAKGAATPPRHPPKKTGRPTRLWEDGRRRPTPSCRTCLYTSSRNCSEGGHSSSVSPSAPPSLSPSAARCERCCTRASSARKGRRLACTASRSRCVGSGREAGREGMTKDAKLGNNGGKSGGKGGRDAEVTVQTVAAPTCTSRSPLGALQPRPRRSRKPHLHHGVSGVARPRVAAIRVEPPLAGRAAVANADQDVVRGRALAATQRGEQARHVVGLQGGGGRAAGEQRLLQEHVGGPHAVGTLGSRRQRGARRVVGSLGPSIPDQCAVRVLNGPAAC